MTEKELADVLIKNAVKYHDPKTSAFPSIVIDKQDYSDFDLNKLKKELQKENYDIIDGILAPNPFAQMEPEFKAKKWFIYRTSL